MLQSELKALARILLLSIAALSLVVAGCGGDDDDDDNGGDVDSETDTGGSTEYDCSGCVAEDGVDVCFGAIAGRMVADDGSPHEGNIQICPATAAFPSNTFATCNVVQSDSDGYFSFDMTRSGECRGYPGDAGATFHIGLISQDYLQYSTSYHPTQDDISTGGPDDFVFDVGDLDLIAVPTTGGQDFDDTNGSSLTFDDVTLDLAAGCGLDDGMSVNVINQVEMLPFVPESLTLDGLYFLSPYFETKLNPKATVTIDVSDMGWTAGQTGKIYQLGEVAYEVYCETTGSEDPVEQGEFRYCIDVTESAGTVTFETQLFTWIGLAKD